MERKTFVMSLAKLMVAAAWADGTLTSEEINALKDVLFTLEDVDADDWQKLELYMDSPPEAGEVDRLLAAVLDQIQSRSDKAYVLEHLRAVFEIDGTVTPDEQALLDHIEAEVSATDTGLLSWLSRALKTTVSKHREHGELDRPREELLEDFVKNTVYYDLVRETEKREIRMSLPEDRLRTLSLAAGLLAHVANADGTISEDERRRMGEILASDWALSPDEAEWLVNVSRERAARGLDYVRVTHGYFEATTYEERRAFLKTLFKVANACGKTSNDEIETIRRMARSLKLSQQDFVDAKLSIPREDRGGL